MHLLDERELKRMIASYGDSRVAEIIFAERKDMGGEIDARNNANYMFEQILSKVSDMLEVNSRLHPATG